MPHWSVTAYNRATHTLVRDTPHSSRSSLAAELAANDDGTVDHFFAPSQPDSGASNWVPTKAGEHFELIFRFYGAQPALQDKTWTLPDLEPLT